MRQVWVFLLLCTSAASAFAGCATATKTLDRPVPHAAQRHTAVAADAAATPTTRSDALRTPTQAAHEASALKVSTVQAAPEALAARGEPSGLERWSQSPLGAPLLISALAMVVIALRRGSR